MSEERKDEGLQTDEQELVTLSLGSMVGLTTERSMKMKGRIGSKEVIVLIDSGATSNFISEKWVHESKLPVTKTRGFGVRVGGGQIIKGKGKCMNVILEIQEVEIIEDFLLFELGATDVILGYAWLAKLGDTKINWGLLKLSWKIGSYWVTLVGDPTLSKEQVALHSMEKVIRHNIGDICWN